MSPSAQLTRRSKQKSEKKSIKHSPIHNLPYEIRNIDLLNNFKVQANTQSQSSLPQVNFKNYLNQPIKILHNKEQVFKQMKIN